MVDFLGFTDIAEETCGVDFVFIEPFYISRPGLECCLAGVPLAVRDTLDEM